MTTAIAESKVETQFDLPETFADIAERLGDIPLNRIIWLPRPATEDDVVRFCEARRPVELIDGFLVEKAMGFRESLLASLLIHHLTNFVLPRKLGLVSAPDAIMRLSPGLVRLPDVSFISVAGHRCSHEEGRTTRTEPGSRGVVRGKHAGRDRPEAT